MGFAPLVARKNGRSPLAFVLYYAGKTTLTLAPPFREHLWRRWECSAMDAEAVLATARSGQIPQYWMVWPLRRDLVLRSALKWAGLSLFGFILFIPALFATVPDNFTGSGLKLFFTSVLLLALGATALGSLGIALYDAWRVLRADEFLIVMTPDDYVKAEPGRITHVPMEHVSYVTMRGVKHPMEQARQAGSYAVGSYGADPYSQIDRYRFMRGLATFRREPTQSPSLAFLDTRSDREVVVATDDSFEALAALEYVLQNHAYNKQRSRTG
jgi:hypothetical protein